MNASNTRNAIASALQGITTATFTDASRELLAALGYRSDRTLDGQTGNVADFITHPNTAIEHTFTQQATFAALIFQVTSNEIGIIDQGQQMLIPAAGFDHQDMAQSFLFMAVELKGTHYPRGQYANFTRAINKRFSAPTVVLFKTADDLLTLAFVHRRAHKHHLDRDVLGSVSLVREIDPTNPHRAHLDILQELSLEKRLRWMNANGQPYNFDGLLAAWLDALDTEELNRQFYRDLFAWFSRATQEAAFPTEEAKTLPAEEHIIRLITRLLFVWFIKEKGLIAEELFVEANVNPLLHGYDRTKGDSYYRAILQNLFFATLNTEIHRRSFSKASNTTHRDPSHYRYENEIADTDNLLQLFARTPFINGGLFDCLDSYEASNQGGYRIDCFSDNPNQRKDYSIPNRLFFDDNGLLPLFNRYKFTVEENTPTEQEVALDPELLGKVFENLLAAYNPETRTTARRQTGSYYTPRPVVDFMVDEALTAAIATRCQPTDGDMDFWRDRLRYLLDYADAFDDANELFEEHECEDIVRAIAHLTVLDPAVGSGAFPMGVLHKLTLALRRLDPQNIRWEKLQKEIARKRADLAFDTQDQQERDAELTNISATFERYRDSDFGRKLYLIQNSIFGVDIQTIATQIAKLRFFISLAIEQEPDPRADNYGIKPLPNLETRFVAANTLLALEQIPQRPLAQTIDSITQLQSELNTNRERYFHATARQQKLACKEKDQELRNDLAAKLQWAGLPADDAEKIAHWDPYDQNASADWFDPTYMFGVSKGFDVVIGNPPYVRQEDIPNKSTYLDQALYTDATTPRSDLYCYFYARALQLLRAQGVNIFICSNSWLDVGFGSSLKRHLLLNSHIQAIYESAVERQFSTAQINTIISIIRNTAAKAGHPTDFVSLRDEFDLAIADPRRRRTIVKDQHTLLSAEKASGNHGDKWGGKYLRAPDIYHTILDKRSDKLVRLGDIATIRRGTTTGANEFFYLDKNTIDAWGIEPEFCHPVMTSPRESRSIAVDISLLPYKIFICHKNKENLTGTGALDYIQWGETQGYHTRRSMASRRLWYDLGKRKTVQIAMNCLVDSTVRIFFTSRSCFFTDNFSEIHSTTLSKVNLCTSMNSSISQLFLNGTGRGNFGGGLLNIKIYEIQNLQIPDPNLLPEIDERIFHSTDWDVLSPSPQRRMIDDAVFEALGLTAGERDAVYEGVRELVENRKQRARSAG